MAQLVHPPGAQPLRRVLWFGLEPIYWFFLGGALLFGGFFLLFGTAPLWLRLLLLLVPFALAVLLAVPYGGCRGGIWLLWGARHLLRSVARRPVRLAARLTKPHPDPEEVPQDTSARPSAWWQEGENDEVLLGEGETDWEEGPVHDGETGWEELRLEDVGEGDEAGWEQPPETLAVEAERGGHARRAPGWEQAPLGAEIGLAWDAFHAQPYDADALFLLDQGPRFQREAGWTTLASALPAHTEEDSSDAEAWSDPRIIPLSRRRSDPAGERRVVGR